MYCAPVLLEMAQNCFIYRLSGVWSDYLFLFHFHSAMHLLQTETYVIRINYAFTYCSNYKLLGHLISIWNKLVKGIMNRQQSPLATLLAPCHIPASGQLWSYEYEITSNSMVYLISSALLFLVFLLGIIYNWLIRKFFLR